MKESERLKKNLRSDLINAICASLGFACAIIIAMWLTIGWCLVLCIVISPLFLVGIVHIFIGYSRITKKIRYWRWLESKSEDVPADLEKKYLFYEASLDVTEQYRKDVARMEERARSIKAEIEAEMKK